MNSKTKAITEEKWNVHIHFPKKYARYLMLIPVIAIALLLSIFSLHGDNATSKRIGLLLGGNAIVWTFAWAKRVKDLGLVLVMGLGVVLGLLAGLVWGLLVDLVAGLFVGLLVGLLVGLVAGLEDD